MNKAELVADVAERTGLTKAGTASVLNSLIESVKQAVADGEEVRISDLFTLTVERREAKTGRNPRTGEPVQIPAKNAVKIKPAKSLVDAANSK